MQISLSENHFSTGSLTRSYLKEVRYKLIIMGALAVFLLFMATLAVTHGAYQISFRELIAALWGSGSDASRVVITNIRLPRVAAAVVCGWGLSVAGLGLQSLLKNPLGSPHTLGFSQGASFGAAAAVVLFNAQIFTVTLCAFAGTLLTTLIILLLAQVKRLSPEAIILAGVAISAFFHSATILMQYIADETKLAMVIFWTFGDVARSNWPEIALLTAVTILVSIFLGSRRWDLNALATDEEIARGLGVNVERLRITGIVALTLVVALATAFHGVIAFLGLIAPHISRRMVGDDHRLLLPFTGLVGALLLLSADTIGRIVIGSGALPVGVITSFMGAPMFLFLLMRRYR